MTSEQFIDQAPTTDRKRQPANHRRTPDGNTGVAQNGLASGSGVSELAKLSGWRLDLGGGGGENFAPIT